MAANACLRLPATTAVRPEEGVPNSKSAQGQPRLYFNKPSWIITTQSGAKRDIKRKAKGRCVICLGTGRVDCFNCSGKGRTNCVDMEMLPKGEWPKWCRSCGGSGLSDCSRCLGTGEYRYIMGFRFLNQQDDVDPQL
uniref:Protein EMBRYO SAC DEVELOPMENT ARREST 3, chloroplastic n=1 Tax=Noccaea caerulescens TaxID=107243 RepID=A0A1J3FYM0_NOCCA